MRLVPITRKIEFDAGHRIPNHKSKCRNIHGHRYVLHATVLGPVKDVRGESDDGMTQDFGDIKGVMMREIHDAWDHAFLIWQGDVVLLEMINELDVYQQGMNQAPHRTVILPVVPTAEHLAILAYEKLNAPINSMNPDMKLGKVVLYETPNCWAEFSG